jgi:hypothetical protein
VADFIHVDAARNIIFDARTKNRTPIAVVGLRDSILVQTDDAVLLAHKSQAQKVKELVKKLGEDAKLKKAGFSKISASRNKTRAWTACCKPCSASSTPIKSSSAPDARR